MYFTSLSPRHLLLDLHASEHCLAIGASFQSENLRQLLHQSSITAVQLYASCCHGWCYYPHAVHGLSHPNLHTDLVGEIAKVCREESIPITLNISVSKNARAANEHPEWCIRNAAGKINGSPGDGHPHSTRPKGWKNLCLNSPYRQQVLDVTKEIMERFQPDGVNFDLLGEEPCYCEYCQEAMLRQKLNPLTLADNKRFATLTYKHFLKAASELVQSIKPQTAVFHGGTDKKGRHDLYVHISHLEIDAGTNGASSYDSFATKARYFTQLQPRQVLGKTSAFLEGRGDFGSFKHQDALLYECALIASLGCQIAVSDQLHPSGYQEPATYQIIGHAYKHLQEREPWLVDAKPYADVAVLATMEMLFDQHSQIALAGASQMLMEKQIPHVLIDETMDISPYRLLILPDRGRLDPGVREKLNRFLKQGGAILASYESGLNMSANDFALEFGADFSGASPWDAEYIEPVPSSFPNLPKAPFFSGNGGMTCIVKEAEVLATVRAPMFNRTYAHFCSDRQSPAGERTSWPGALRHGNLMYLAHPLFTAYYQQGLRLHRDFVISCLDLLYQERLLTCTLPSCARINVTWQAKENRHLLHLFYAASLRRGCHDTIEDIVTMRDVDVTFAAQQRPKAICLVPEGTALPFTCNDQRVAFTIPELKLTQMVAIEY